MSGIRRQLANTVVVAIALVATTLPARADNSPTATIKAQTGRTDRLRLWHVLAALGGGALYVSSENIFKGALTADDCRWCTPPGVDARIQRQLVWNDPVAADHYSNLTGHLASPLFTVGTLALSSLDNRSWRRWFDDTLPVLEAVVITNLITQAVKFSAARQRPFAYVGGPAVQPDGDRNMSFVSGHASLGFTLAASAGTVATLRGYRSAPYIWAGGMALAVTTAYLRMAADAHYFTDVLVGGLIGAGAGIGVPLLLHRDVLAHRVVEAPLVVIPSGPRGSLGVSISGEF